MKSIVSDPGFSKDVRFSLVSVFVTRPMIGHSARGRVLVHDHVGQGAEHDHQGHQHHDQPEHAEGDHLEHAVILGGPVLGEHPHLQSEMR